MDILSLQKCQLSRDNDPGAMLDPTDKPTLLAEMSMWEGDLVPLVIRTGPMGKPDPGMLKRYTAVEINGEGMGFVMIWIANRLVAYGTLFAQEAPQRVRRLNIPRGLGNGYDIDLYIAFQGRGLSWEVFFEELTADVPQ